MKFNSVFNKGWLTESSFWVAYSLFWHVIFAPEPFAVSDLIFTACMTAAHMSVVYLHLNVVSPRRQSGQIGVILYSLGLVFLTLLGTGLIWLFLMGVFTFIPYSQGLIASLKYAFFTYWAGSFLSSTIMVLAITYAINLIARKRDQERRAKELEFEKTQSELQYLRGQLNPHFLFNALNGIYFLIPQNPEKAAEVLAGFSDLLRYQLYRSEDKQVPLAEELQYLDRFAELSLMRLESDFVYELDVDMNEQLGSLPPMLLLPILENAFKHSPNRNGWIKGRISLTETDRLFVRMSNNYHPEEQKPTATQEKKSGGIGLENIKRRLELLYPEDHSFDIQQAKGVFSIDMEIPFAVQPALVSS
ncbi:MAG: histidine kinase [Bacteroidota bacterium]